MFYEGYLVIEPGQWLVFAFAALGLLLVPGPSVLYIIARGVSQGRRAAFASVLGIQLGGMLHILAAALGISAVILSSALLFQALKLLGAAYLVYIGVRTWLSKTTVVSKGIEAQPIRTVFWQGFVVNALNPKTALFFLAFLPQFINPSRGSVVAQILVLGLTFIGLATITDGIYALLSGSLKGYFERFPALERHQHQAIGTVYVGLGVTTVFLQNK
jgi:threonine/homoserine/homoserine lactone efflux protein